MQNQIKKSSFNEIHQQKIQNFFGSCQPKNIIQEPHDKNIPQNQAKISLKQLSLPMKKSHIILAILLGLIIIALISGLCIYFYQKADLKHKNSTKFYLDNGELITVEDYQYKKKSLFNEVIDFNYSIWKIRTKNQSNSNKESQVECIMGNLNYLYYRRCNKSAIEFLVDFGDGFREEMIQLMNSQSINQPRLLQNLQQSQFLSNGQINDFQTMLQQNINSKNLKKLQFKTFGIKTYEYNQTLRQFQSKIQPNKQISKRLLVGVINYIRQSLVRFVRRISNSIRSVNDAQNITTEANLRSNDNTTNTTDTQNLKRLLLDDLDRRYVLNILSNNQNNQKLNNIQKYCFARSESKELNCIGEGKNHIYIRQQQKR